MQTRNSIAGPEKGLEIPETKEVYGVSEPDSPESTDESGDFTVIQWSGGEYSRQNTWIQAHEDSILDLEEVR